MKMKFDFNYEAWIQNVEVEGANEEECKQNLYKMTLEDLLKNGAYIKNSDITEEEGRVTEAHYKVRAYNLEFHPLDIEDNPSLEHVTELEVEFDHDLEDYSLEDAIKEAINDQLDASPESMDYTILETR